MKIETYEVSETTTPEETVQHEAAAVDLIERLGLEGQKSLMTTHQDKPQQICPYRLMTRDEHFVFRQLCPKRDDVRKFRNGPIPLRVLQIIAWAIDAEIFKRVEIWSADSASIKDPVLVGIKQSPESSWSEDIFILARWADELLPIEVLLPDAYKAYVRKRITEAQSEIKRVTRSLEEAEFLKGLDAHVPSDWSGF
jgi:hypothetical protein